MSPLSFWFLIKSNLENITKLFCLFVDFLLDLADEDQTDTDPNKKGDCGDHDDDGGVHQVDNLEASVGEVSNEKDKSGFGKSKLVASTPC